MNKNLILILKLSTLGLFFGFLTSCANVGPHSISVSRTAYAEAIDQTENEQLLLMVVKGRYGETASFLAVNAVAANIRFRTEAGIEAGFGPNITSGENLLIGGLAYEENPTITYSPVQGQKYIRQLESPVPLDLVLLVMRSPTLRDRIMTLLISRANNLNNPSFLFETSADTDYRFKRFVELFNQLYSVGVLELVKNQSEDITADILIGGYGLEYKDDVYEFMSLLNLPVSEGQTQTITIPTYSGIHFDKSLGLGITTRTTFDLVEVLRATIDVPEEHIKSGIVLSYPQLGSIGEGIKINVSKTKPNNRSLAVLYRSYWYYIDEADQATKGFFNVLRMLWSITIDNSMDARDVPLMTIPVSQ